MHAEEDEGQGPRAVYQRRLDARQEAVSRYRSTEWRFSAVRMVIFTAGALMAWPALFTDRLPWWSLGLPVVAFVVAAWLHDRVIRRRRRAERAVGFYERGLARLDDRWAGSGSGGGDWFDAAHPYAEDLDVCGHASLFELLSAARTLAGEQTLALWLSAPAPPEQIRQRQGAVEELRDRLDLREQLAILGAKVAQIDPGALVAWATAPPVLTSRWPVAVAGLLALANFTTFLLWMASPLGNVPFLLSIVAGSVFGLLFRERVHRVLGRVERPEHDLELLAGLLARLEAERFSSPLLRELHRALYAEGQPPSRRIARLARLVQMRDSRENALFRPFAAMLLLGTQLAFAMERWRGSSGAAVERWVEAVGSIEALTSLAQLAFEHPADPFPEVVEEGPCFEGEGLGHPLLPANGCVLNDVRLDAGRPLLLVSGSNMSGKSTLLRTVGVNAVLALAGAPVRARRLVLSPLSIGACMRIRDSLQEGTSHFYAEIRKLRQIVDLGGGGHAVLFLLDEILHGTNSHDRRIGAEALIRGLLERGGLGLVTTHDLALAEIADGLGTRAANVHFEDRLEDGRIVFDYRLRPGVVRKSNALDLMRAVGLDV